MTDKGIAKLKEPALVLSPPQLLEQAVEKGASIEVIERLLGLQERWEANQAKKAFNAAIAAFKADPPQLLKTSEVSYGAGKTSYKHEDLAEVLAAVDPALAKHGLWVRFKIHSEPGLVTVKCIIGHADGYSEEAAELQGAPDTSGAKNAIQAIGSTTSYLQRYTLKAALGMAAARDDDGRGGNSGAKVITSEQADTINRILLANKHIDVTTFLGLAGAASVSDILQVKYDAAIGYLGRKAKDPVSD